MHKQPRYILRPFNTYYIHVLHIYAFQFKILIERQDDIQAEKFKVTVVMAQVYSANPIYQEFNAVLEKYCLSFPGSEVFV